MKLDKEQQNAGILRWHICNRKLEYRDIPGVFADRVLKMGILSFLILIFGIFMGIQMDSFQFMIWSVVLGVVIFVRTLLLFRTALSGRYEVEEGTILEIIERTSVGKFQKIKLRLVDGKETYLLLEKSIHVEPGIQYRFYFNSSQNALSGIRTIDAVLNVGSFYGLEKMESG